MKKDQVVAIYDNLPRFAVEVMHTNSSIGRLQSRKRVPWQPRHGGKYEIEGWDALKPSARTWAYVIRHPILRWRELSQWRQLQQHDLDERRRAEQASHELLKAPLQAR